MTKAAYNRVVERERMLHDLMRVHDTRSIAVLLSDMPSEWHTVGWDIDVRPPKTKVTLYLEKSVAAFFREMGVGYQDRINRVLAVYMRMCLQDWRQIEDGLRERMEERKKRTKEAKENGEF